MRKKYKDLNLKSIREKADLDFAHFTYQRGMCSCCFGPKDQPSMYWRDRKIKTGDDFTYILFKNASNGSGCVTAKDEIKDYTCVQWRFPENKMDLICSMLQEQLGDAYIVVKPKNKDVCILIREKEELKKEERMKKI